MPTLRPALDRAAAVTLAEACLEPPSDAARQVGLELEWLAYGPDGERPALDRLRAAVGDLPVTFEPGGQVELVTAPAPTAHGALTDALDGAAELDRRLSADGIRLVALGLDPVRPPARLLDQARYEAMEATFAGDGEAGIQMMCNTASVQVNVDLDAGGQRWRVAHQLGPVLAAAFANSPFRDGRPSDWQSGRLATWAGIDPTRTAPVGADDHSWSEYALEARVLLIRADDDHYVPLPAPLPFGRWLEEGHELGWPTADDFAYHLTTLFPPVRPRGWIELRMLDSLDPTTLRVAVAVATALLDHPDAVAPSVFAPVAGLWQVAARRGLHDERLASAAACCFRAAAEVLADEDPECSAAVDDWLGTHVLRRRTPADDLLDEWQRSGRVLPAGWAPGRVGGQWP